MVLTTPDLQLVRCALIKEISAQVSSLDDDLRGMSIYNACSNLRLDVELLQRVADALIKAGE